MPFVKRENYILVKAYTFNERTVQQTPIVPTNKVKPKGVCPVGPTTMNVSSCFGWSKLQKTSLTIPMWTEAYVSGRNFIVPPGNFTDSQLHGEDPVYAAPEDTDIYKLLSPWLLNCNKPDIPFIMTKHMLNHTPMDIISGILLCGNYAYGSHIFYRSRETDDYKINYREPLVSMNALSELPIHVECYCDKDKYNMMFSTQFNTRPYFRGVTIKDHLYNNKNIDKDV